MYYTHNSVCTAHISVNKNRVKIYGSEVFLKDGQNFEIELYNPKQNSVLAKISINGQQISSSGFFLRPGQRVFIERFIDTPKKFVFSTYEVSNTQQNRQAVEKNGLVEVSFYDEYVPAGITTTITTGGGWLYNTPTYIYTNGNVGLGTSSPSTTLNLTGTTTTSNAFYSSTASNNYGFNAPVSGTTNWNIHVDGSAENHLVGSKAIETGRVEAGPDSSQSFGTAYGNFNSWASSTTSIKILPVSLKPVESSEVRNYCTNCGTRAKKSTWKFCPSCGSKL